MFAGCNGKAACKTLLSRCWEGWGPAPGNFEIYVLRYILSNLRLPFNTQASHSSIKGQPIIPNTNKSNKRALLFYLFRYICILCHPTFNACAYALQKHCNASLLYGVIILNVLRKWVNIILSLIHFYLEIVHCVQQFITLGGGERWVVCRKHTRMQFLNLLLLGGSLLLIIIQMFYQHMKEFRHLFSFLYKKAHCSVLNNQDFTRLY